MPDALTPLMAQYQRIKARHPGEILFFRLGDFYETFNEDAQVASRVLGIALTGRFSGDKRVPMAGVPQRNVHTYIHRLLHAGHRVAICDQVEEADESTGKLVDREVVRIISPGTLLEEVDLADRRPHYLAALTLQDERPGIAWADLSTGAFHVREPSGDLLEEIRRIGAAEILVPDGLSSRFSEALKPAMVTPFTESAFEREEARRNLSEHFGVADLQGYGLGGLGPALGAAGALLRYLRDTQRGPLAHLRPPKLQQSDREAVLDRITLRALQVVESQADRTADGSLLGELDRCETAMGSRTLRSWLSAPLTDPKRIAERHDAVGELAADPSLARELGPRLRAVGDLQRLAGRLGSGRAAPRDLGGLRDALAPLPDLAERLATARAALLRVRIDPHRPLWERLADALVDAPPQIVSEGGIFRPGFDDELDRMSSLRSDARGVLDRLERREIERTGIPSLKVGFNSVFGYYIEVTHAHAARVPSDYVRKQTIKNAERYITAELKDLETQILNSEESARKRERELFERLRAEAAREIRGLQGTADAVAEIDALASMARVAREREYVRPEICEEPELQIEAGRHPALEGRTSKPFVPNDVRMDSGRRILVITGPNMAGKSTYIRQVALTALMAQAGSFVPARRARIGVVDRFFTRIGAGDDLERGISTFMQEMLETARILHQATERSLVVLDELGRGTSTFDGVSIAWAVCEQLHHRVGARTLFATHYHELTGLSATLPRLANLHAGVREWKGELVFQYRIEEGATNRSYGIQVGRLAGLPPEVIERAKLILAQLEEMTAGAATPHQALQLGLFRLVPKSPDAPPPHPILQELARMDPDSLTPLEALKKIAEWAARVRA